MAEEKKIVEWDKIQRVEGNNRKIYASKSDVEVLKESVSGKYTKPTNGIPKTDLENGVQTSLTNADSHIIDTNNPHDVTKEQVGLGNVSNDAQVKRSEMGEANGVATLDENGHVPSSQLPSYVDDVEEYENVESFPTEGESGKVYIDTTTNITYRWGGTTYVPIGSDLALGETESTAYSGAKGKKNAEDIEKFKGDEGTEGSIAYIVAQAMKGLTAKIATGTLSVGTATTLANLDVTKGIIVANLSASSSISLSGAMEVGQTLTIVINNTSASDITQAIPVTNGWTCIQGDSMTITASKISELSILCYAENKYSVSFVSAQ